MVLDRTAAETVPTLTHQQFCLPRPGSVAVRIERYKFDRENRRDGTTTRVTMTRCVECGAARVDE